ncbi:ribosomal-protein-alanine N-acetyltransferase [Scopulibacillus darangshiensis]|uniref:Ribosomal-protein-alanine N-acetyltransferase n=1 Tax=Scopulibacillus darangshiensis TaxID=442528 RepID=A0A4R2P9F7_9BACL|nr:GNAT family N-acetyltransferase [Scopulibacillus darangshiensis]TCP30495.1 ribosomal-protein-alanine N-acetyltransferase [Scopulibacillus darangshiensis]
MIIREISVSDAEAFLRLSRGLDKETQYMLYEPGERSTTLEEQRARIEKIHNKGFSTIFVAEDEEQLVGYAGIFGSALKRVRHRASIVIGILPPFQGRGLGTKLLGVTHQWAKEKGIHRLELTVMEHNRHAMYLYNKMGYRVEGMRKSAIVLEDRTIDEFYMGKILKADKEK